MDEEELRAKQWMRATTRRAGRVLFFLFCLVVLLLAGIEAALVHGPSPILLWGPLTVYACLAVWQARRRRWALALACLLGASLYARLFFGVAAKSALS